MTRARITMLLLIASLVMNAGFVGGYFYVRQRAREMQRPAKRIEAIARRLQLDPQQRRLLERLKREARAIRVRYREQTDIQRRHLWHLLGNPAVEPDAIDQSIQRMARSRMNYQKKIVGIIRRFVRSLKPEQRRRFVKILTGNRRLSALLLG